MTNPEPTPVLPPDARAEWEELARLAREATPNLLYVAVTPIRPLSKAEESADLECDVVSRADAAFLAYCTPERIGRLVAAIRDRTLAAPANPKETSDA